MSGYGDVHMVPGPHRQRRPLAPNVHPHPQHGPIPLNLANLANLAVLAVLTTYDSPSGHVTPRRGEPSHANQYEPRWPGTVEGQTARNDGEA